MQHGIVEMAVEQTRSHFQHRSQEAYDRRRGSEQLQCGRLVSSQARRCHLRHSTHMVATLDTRRVTAPSIHYLGDTWLSDLLVTTHTASIAYVYYSRSVLPPCGVVRVH